MYKLSADILMPLQRVLRSLNVQVSTEIAYTHTSNSVCKRQIRVLREKVRIWCKTECTKDWLGLLPVISLMMNSQESSATSYSPHELCRDARLGSYTLPFLRIPTLQ